MIPLALIGLLATGALSLPDCASPGDLVPHFSPCDASTLLATHSHSREVYFSYGPACNDSKGADPLPRPVLGLECNATVCPAGTRLDYTFPSANAASLGQGAFRCTSCPEGEYSVGGGSLTATWRNPLAPSFRSACYGYVSRGVYRQSHNCQPWTPSEDGLTIGSGANAGNHRMISVLQMTASLVRDGYLLFRFKVDAEERFDGLRFLVNGEESGLGLVSTALDWRTANVTLKRGSHVFQWEYMKDFAIERGQDQATLRMVQVIGTEYADVACESCSTGFGPGCTVCGANEYQNSATGQCSGCPAGTYSFEGTIGVAGCRQRPACTEADYYLNYTSCEPGANEGDAPSRGGQYVWAQPKICDDALPGAKTLPASDNARVPCAECDPGTERTGTACEFCPAGRFRAPGAQACAVCGVGSTSPMQRHYTQFPSLPSGFTSTSTCDVVGRGGDCPGEVGWRANEEYLTTGVNHVATSDVTLTTRVRFGDAGGQVSFTYSLVNPLTSGRTKLLFYVDSVTRGSFDAAAGNQTVGVEVGAGERVLQWIYRRDNADGDDTDRALIHDIVLTGTTTGGASQCNKCERGTRGVAGPDGVPICEPCPAGQFSDAEGSLTCEPCPEGTFSPLSGSAKCTTCGAGTSSKQGSSICEVDTKAVFTNTSAPAGEGVFEFDLTPLLASDTRVGSLRGPVTLPNRGGDLLFFSLGHRLPAVYTAGSGGEDNDVRALVSASQSNATYAAVLHASTRVVSPQPGSSSQGCEESTDYTWVDAGSFAEVVVAPKSTVLGLLSAGVLPESLSAEIEKNRASGDAAASSSGRPVVTLVYTRGDRCARTGPDADRNLSTVVVMSCRVDDADAEADAANPPGDVVFSDNCTAAYNVLTPLACAACTSTDYDVQISCDAVTAVRVTECADSEKARENAVGDALAAAGYASASDVRCYEEVAKDLETARGRTMALGAILGIVALVLVVIGALLFRLRKRHTRTQRELKKYLDQYGDSLLDKDGMANDGGSDSEEIVSEMPALNPGDRI